jgi:quinol monooxygenase YgiN
MRHMKCFLDVKITCFILHVHANRQINDHPLCFNNCGWSRVQGNRFEDDRSLFPSLKFGFSTHQGKVGKMIGFQILVNVPRDKRQEFIQTCDLLGDAACRNSACIEQTLYENVKEANQFLWVEHWHDGEKMEGYLKSSRFGVLLGAIAVLSESSQLLRLKTEDLNG